MTTLTSPTAKREAMLRAGGRCEKCACRLRRGHYHAHHLTYERHGHERVDDLRILCLDCHGEIHGCRFRPWAGESRHERRVRRAKRRGRARAASARRLAMTDDERERDDRAGLLREFYRRRRKATP